MQKLIQSFLKASDIIKLTLCLLTSTVLTLSYRSLYWVLIEYCYNKILNEKPKLVPQFAVINPRGFNSAFANV